MPTTWDQSSARAKDLKPLVSYGLRADKIKKHCPLLLALAAGDEVAAVELIKAAIESFDAQTARAYWWLMSRDPDDTEQHRIFKRNVRDRRLDVMKLISYVGDIDSWVSVGEVDFLGPLAARCYKLVRRDDPPPPHPPARAEYAIDYFGYFAAMSEDGLTRRYTKIVVIEALVDGVTTYKHPVDKQLAEIEQPQIIQGGTVEEAKTVGAVLSHLDIALPRELRRGERHALTFEWARTNLPRSSNWVTTRPSIPVRYSVVALTYPTDLIAEIRAFQTPTPISRPHLVSDEFTFPAMTNESGYCEHHFSPTPHTSWGLNWTWRE